MSVAWTLETKGTCKECSGHYMVKRVASGEGKRARARTQQRKVERGRATREPKKRTYACIKTKIAEREASGSELKS